MLERTGTEHRYCTETTYVVNNMIEEMKFQGSQTVWATVVEKTNHFCFEYFDFGLQRIQVIGNPTVPMIV